ncbi:MAG: FAD-dependent oxidoreductase [Deltaproteobacteria bacterium]|nr:FAD-dependent oxidoreductase [Deltaproteobacteria bacterium]MBW1935292.1 FAD-dependent oxidoreductase [Deltaproteobacteria bacterium]MBW1978215.1 FAD-dependent oxidoreductase [Deltaproteobacteria bacterium]MBW2300339.1 FAD-dependent oxidoreductase [Deltaproteobacteria bacterium]
MQHLFSPFSIKNIELKNRIVMPGLASFLIEDDGSITDKTVEHYRRRAAGGPAMVIVEACAVSPEGIVSPHQARIYDDRFIEGFSRIAQVMKSEGAVPALQIHHGGRQTSAKVIKRKPLAPSNLPCPTIKGDVEPLTVEGIREIIRKFGDAAARAVEAGFELIEIHGAHGYLINEFLSGFSNIREDRYGGDTAGRARFALEVIREVRTRVGKDFPLSFKISAQEFVPGGLTVEESIKILKLLVPAGLDIIQVSAGNDATPEWISQPMFMEKACLADSAAEIRRALKMPVMAVGRINDPLVAEDIIKQEKADLVCVGRGLLADPEMPLKAKEGRVDDIRICIACNTCMQSIFRKGRVECLVNPSLGREKEMELVPTDTPKKVMVVGGGPGGLHVAWVAARRGHEVHLYEKQAELGGQLTLGSVTKYKKELLSLIRFQKRQIEKSGVRTHLNSEVTLKTITKEKPDVIVLSTGSIPIRPEVPGIEKPIVRTLSEAFSDDQVAGKRTVIVGGGATGCEVAHHLSESGSSVTIVEQLGKLAEQLESVTRKVLLQQLRENNVQFLTRHKLSKVEDNGVWLEGPDRVESFLEAEAVVIAVGNRPDNRLYEQLKGTEIPVYQIGDCLEPRTAKAAISDAALIGRAI